MINEALLSQEGYRLGLDLSDQVQKYEKKLLKEEKMILNIHQKNNVLI